MNYCPRKTQQRSKFNASKAVHNWFDSTPKTITERHLCGGSFISISSPFQLLFLPHTSSEPRRSSGWLPPTPPQTPDDERRHTTHHTEIYPTRLLRVPPGHPGLTSAPLEVDLGEASASELQVETKTLGACQPA